MEENGLIRNFVELHSQTEQLLNQDKVQEAKQKYLEVVTAYQAIDKSTLEHYHKELAYGQVTILFKKVNDAKERIKVPYHLISAAVLIIAFSILVVLKPSIVGLAGFEDLVRHPVDITFTESGIQQINLRDRPLTLSASGEFTGQVKLYYKQGEKLELLFDSTRSPSEDGKFTDICEETCDIIARSNIVELFAQVDEGSSLTINEVSYKVERTNNNAPVWKGKTRKFTAKPGETTIIDLAEYFEDPEKDPMVFLSTTDSEIDVIVQNSEVAVTPIKGASGIKKVIFIASDLLEVTRVPVNIEIK